MKTVIHWFRRDLRVASLSDDLIHQPWVKPLPVHQSKYPSRIVRHEEQRPKCLAMFAAVKKTLTA